MMQTPMTYRAHTRAILILGLPLVGGHVAQFAISLTDTIMLGRYGVPELAALTLASSFFFVFFLFGSGFAWAVMPMVAQYAAEGNETQIRRATRMALWLSGGFFALAMPILWWSQPILLSLGQEAGVAQMAQDYLRIAGWGLLPALSVMVFKSYLAALEHTRVVFWITVAAALMNALANYALIFGNWGAPELGIAGAAIASLVSHATALAGVIFYAGAKLPQYPLWQRFWRPDTEMMREVFQLGLPIGLTTLAEVGLFSASAVLIGWIGAVPLAAHGIALQISAATFMVHLGLSNAATVRAGQARGRRDPVFLKRGAVAALSLSAVAVIVTIALFLIVPRSLIGLFLSASDPDRAAILSLGAALLAVAALFQFVDAAQVMTLGLLRGLQDTRVPMFIASVAYWLLGLPAAYMLGFTLGLGAVGIWFGLVVGLGTAAVLLVWRFWGRAVPDLTARSA